MRVRQDGRVIAECSLGRFIVSNGHPVAVAALLAAICGNFSAYAIDGSWPDTSRCSRRHQSAQFDAELVVQQIEHQVSALETREHFVLVGRDQIGHSRQPPRPREKSHLTEAVLLT